MMSEAVITKHSIFTFGCSHASLLALELYYRSGGLMVINPVRAAGLNLDIDPATMTSQMERLPEYGTLIADNQPIKEGDVVIVHSVSGRNTVTVDFAMRCQEKGAKVIALTNMNTAGTTTSRHPSGKHLHDAADLVIDNCGCFGDAAINVEGITEKVGPTSTAVGAAILNAIMVQTVQNILDAGEDAPVFMSANVDGGEEHNARMLEMYKDHIFYMN